MCLDCFFFGRGCHPQEYKGNNEARRDTVTKKNAGDINQGRPKTDLVETTGEG